MRSAKFTARASRGGFTLLELMVVVVILGILLGVVALNVQGKDDKAKVTAARASMRNIENAIEMFKLDTGKYPEKMDDLIVESTNFKGWNGPYLKEKAMPKDPWGKEFLYQAPGGEGRPYDVVSLGRDGAPGGQGFDGDILGSSAPDEKK